MKKLILLVIYLISINTIAQITPPTIYYSQKNSAGASKARNLIFFINGNNLYTADGINQPVLITSLGTVDDVEGFYGTDSAYYFQTMYYGVPLTYHQVWKSDGTAAGTHVLYTHTNIDFADFIAVKDTVFFNGSGNSLNIIRPDNSIINVGSGKGLFEYQDQLLVKSGYASYYLIDPVTHGTTTLINLPGVYVENIIPIHDTLFFSTGFDLNYLEPSGHTIHLIDTGHFAFSTMLGRAGNSLVFSAKPIGTNDLELYSLDHTTMTINLLKDIYSGPTGSSINFPIQSQNKLFFLATDNIYGEELWVTDGTIAGTKIVVDLSDASHSTTTNIPWPYGSEMLRSKFTYVHGDTLHISLDCWNTIDSTVYLVTTGDQCWRILVSSTRHQWARDWVEFNGSTYVSISPNFGIASMFRFNGNLLTNVNSIVENPNIRIFPNPGRNDLWITGSTEMKQVEVFDFKSCLVRNFSNINSRQFYFDVSGISNGLYFIKVTGSSGISVLKFIKE